ncbi:MAG TPA: methyl-accepting chemotaxis protein, partial [Leucothrix sp.]|nr:methyl-accepting chemotaxis protein [Leucothrix sp.]
IQQSLLYILGGVVITLILGVLIMRSITNPTNSLTQVVQRLSQGEFDARAKIIGTDEFSKLSKAFNHLLDERANTLEHTETEYQKLNQSVFKLLQTVAELSEKNLTIRAEVTEDATGPVADAINLFAEETAATLSQVRDVAAHVNQTSQIVNTHLMSVNKLAIKEQEQAIETTDQMDKMLQRLDAIATSATETNKMADNTKISTEKAHKYVSGTLDGMAEIRETVQETGRRIKVLGERSQEISHVIEIINSIAERTTVLALNASMQAVAAGDAGRGFSVIAEEIQRLAESSRDSTEQISTLVRNIQQETNTTIATMDKTIEQVINGSTRAEDAVQQMKEVLETTTQLIHSVDLIASASHEQVSISKNLKHKAQNILKSTQSTGQELLSLTGLSRKMAEYAQQLVHSVNVFTIDKNTPRRNSK